MRFLPRYRCRRIIDVCLTTNSKADPTNTADPRRKLYAKIRARKKEAMKRIREFAKSIPVSVAEIPEGPVTNRRVYLYELRDIDIQGEIRAIIEHMFDTGTDKPPMRWFFDSEINEVVTRATAQEVERINSLVSIMGETAPYRMEQILMSQPFRDRIARVRARVFEEMKGFTTDTANDLGRTLAQQMAQGKGIRSATKQVADRFDIKERRAQTIARTELGKAHRDAREAQTKDARDRLDLDALTQWISALAPTSRRSHMARHLKFYTPEQNAEFYASPESQGSQINCLCTQATIIRTKDGEILGARKA